MTESEQAKHEAELKAAYQRGFRDSRHFPNRREPDLTVDAGRVIPSWERQQREFPEYMR